LARIHESFPWAREPWEGTYYEQYRLVSMKIKILRLLCPSLSTAYLAKSSPVLCSMIGADHHLSPDSRTTLEMLRIRGYPQSVNVLFSFRRPRRKWCVERVIRYPAVGQSSLSLANISGPQTGGDISDWCLMEMMERSKVQP
jgi:hypothetical protein